MKGTEKTNDVIVNISSSSSSQPQQPPSNSSPEQLLTRRKTISRSSFSKPKSRLVEPHVAKDAKLTGEKEKTASTSPHRTSPTVTSKPVTPKTPLLNEDDEEEEDDDEEVYQTASVNTRPKKGKKLKLLVVIEWAVFVLVMGLLVASLTVNKLQNHVLWGLELWKWCVLVVVIFCGRLFTGWFINVIVFCIEKNFLLKKKVLYFVYGMKGSVRVFVWLGLVLLAWLLLFNRGVRRSKETNRVLDYITKALVSFLVGSAIWLLKTLLVKLVATSFQCSRFFDRIQESIFHQYVLRILSGPPLMEMAEQVGRATTPGHLSFSNLEKQRKDKKEEVIDVQKLKKMRQEKVSAWTMKGLINVISGSGLSTVSNALDSFGGEESEQKDEEITSEWEAKLAAYRIFRNVAKHGSK